MSYWELPDVIVLLPRLWNKGCVSLACGSLIFLQSARIHCKSPWSQWFTIHSEGIMNRTCYTWLWSLLHPWSMGLRDGLPWVWDILWHVFSLPRCLLRGGVR